MKSQAEQRELRDGMLALRIVDDGKSRTIELAGELDMANAATLAAELEATDAERGGTVTLDMSELEFIDSTGIAVLIAAHKRLHGSGCEVRLVRSRASAVQRVMEVTGLHRELPFAPAGESAGG